MISRFHVRSQIMRSFDLMVELFKFSWRHQWGSYVIKRMGIFFYWWILKIFIFCLLTHFLALSMKPICFRIRIIWNLALIFTIRVFVIIVFSKVDYFIVVEVRHLRQQLFHVLFAILRPQYEFVKFKCLKFYNNLGNCTLEINSCNKLSIFFCRKLLFTKLDTNYWL